MLNILEITVSSMIWLIRSSFKYLVGVFMKYIEGRNSFWKSPYTYLWLR